VNCVGSRSAALGAQIGVTEQAQIDVDENGLTRCVSGELLYEHVMGHRHHDHLLCTDCGRIEEFYDETGETAGKMSVKLAALIVTPLQENPPHV